MKTYRFRFYPSKLRERQLTQHLHIAKNLWNDLLEHSKNMHRDYGKFPTKNSPELRQELPEVTPVEMKEWFRL